MIGGARVATDRNHGACTPPARVATDRGHGACRPPAAVARLLSSLARKITVRQV
jgi:hypothetical protein